MVKDNIEKEKILEEKVLNLLKNMASKSSSTFSGIGIVAYDSKEFSKSNYTDLRPGFKLEKLDIEKPGTAEKLLEITDYKNTLHDGFCLVNEDGEVTHVAQYFVPKIVEGLVPNQNHGVRTFSAACGSKVEGVNFVGMISCNNEIYLYKDGQEIVHDAEFQTADNH